MLTLLERRDPIDLTMVTDVLVRRDQLQRVGGSVYLAELTERAIVPGNVAHHARLVRQKATLRSLINVASELQASAFKQDDVTAIVGQAHDSLMHLTNAQATSSLIAMPDLMTRALHRMEASTQHVMSGVPSGFYDLDEKTGGFQPSNLIVLAARPGLGKTSMALQCATHAAAYLQRPVLFFSLEMSADELAQRLLCSEARVDSAIIRRGQLTQAQWGPLMNAANRLRDLPVVIDDTASLTVLELRSRATRVHMQGGLGMIVVDYLQLLRTHTRTDNRVQEISEISRGLKGLAKDLQVPVIALSQLNRDVEKRGEGVPQLSDLRDGGSIEQDSDVVLFIHRKSARKSETAEEEDSTPHDHTAELIIAKQRNGPTGTVKLTFLNKTTRFENLSTQADPF
jgi:replicative DNA helicase